MVRVITFILLLATFFGAHIGFEVLMKKRKLSLSLKQVIIMSIGIEFVLIILAGNIASFFYVLIYGNIVLASFINIFYKNIKLGKR